MTSLINLSPSARYNMAEDGFGNLVPISAVAWSSAYYHVHGKYNCEY